uniref:HGD n=1 Tax=Arundo donax TaxID=35708 RepID=A0A0A9HDQ0_ARUDO
MTTERQPATQQVWMRKIRLREPCVLLHVCKGRTESCGLYSRKKL